MEPYRWSHGRRSMRKPSGLIHEQVLIPVRDVYDGLTDIEV